MAGLQNTAKGSMAGRTIKRFLRFGVLRGLRSIEVDPEDFRQNLADKHGLWVPDFARMKDVPTERLDAIAAALIRDAERLALAEGAGLGLGGMITFLPDASLLTVITLRLIQRLSLLYGFEARGQDQRIEMWKAAAAASGIDYGKDLAEKQILEKLVPRIAERFAAKIGAEAAEKWAGRLIPLASSAIGGALNCFFCERVGPPRASTSPREASSGEGCRPNFTAGVSADGKGFRPIRPARAISMEQQVRSIRRLVIARSIPRSRHEWVRFKGSWGLRVSSAVRSR